MFSKTSRLLRGLPSTITTINRTIIDTIKVRPVDLKEIPVLEDLSTKANWHVSHHLVEACYAYDPEGFLVAANPNNEPLGFIAGCNLDDKTSFGGFFIVQEDLRGKGIGSKLFAGMEKHIGDRNLVCNAVLNQIPYYKRRNITNELHEINVYESTPSLQEIETLPDNHRFQIDELSAKSESSAELFKALVSYDESVHLIRRELFLSKFLIGETAYTFVARLNGKVVGYGCIYKRKELTYALGPLFADYPEIAPVLLKKMLKKIAPGSSVSLDLPITQNGAEQIVHSCGFKRVNKTLRMSRKEQPNIPWNRVYCATTTDISLI